MSQEIERLKEMPRVMTAEQAAYVMDRSRDFIIRACNSKPAKLEHRADNGRGTGSNHRYYITREAMLVFIVRTTGGDRFTLMQAITDHLPLKLQELAQKVAAASTQPTELPPNVLPMRASNRRAGKPAPLFDHPDLFASDCA